ncbi:MAG: hypothetical protein ACTIDE_02080 [Carnobacterium maltaromaticum]|nr:hypothetical protein [Carnobacterium maltaromaticum]
MNHKIVYNDLRNQALNVAPEELNLNLESENQVYASLIDLKIKDKSMSLFCSFDGTVSLYFEDREPVVGLGMIEDIKTAAISLLISSGQTLGKLELFDVSKIDNSFEKERVVLMASQRYVAFVNNQNNSREIQFLDFLIQNVISEIRKSDVI